MPIITIEGIDRSGKTTQAAALYKRMAAKYNVQVEKLPDRTMATGQIIDRMLKTPRSLSGEESGHYISSLQQTSGKSSRRHGELLAAGGYLIIDRYIYSALAYGATDGLDEHWIASLHDGLPRADYVFWMVLPPEIAQTRRMETGLELFEALHTQRDTSDNFSEYSDEMIRLDATMPIDTITDIMERIVQDDDSDLYLGKWIRVA